MTDTIGIDLDTHDGYTFTRTYLNASRFGSVEVERTRRGFHLTITPDVPVDTHKALDIRRLLGDCPGRLEYDEFRLEVGDHASFDTLFTWKRGAEAVPFRPGGLS